MKNIIDILRQGFSSNHEKDYIDTVIDIVKSKTGYSEEEILQKAYQYCHEKGKDVNQKSHLEWCFVDFDVREFGDVKPYKRAKDLLKYI
jgi:hypothetical protein